MHVPQILILAAGLGQVIASPAPTTNAPGLALEAKYDDLGAIPIVPLTPMTSPYKELIYQNFNVLGRGLDLLPGSLKPFSTPNSIYFDLLTQLGGGIATIKPVSGTFDLKSMRFGCSTLLGLTRIPLDCTVVASTIDKDGLRQSTTLKFTKSETMELFKFPKHAFEGIKQVSFVIVGQALLDTTFAGTLDNLKYVIHH